jgi:hypothetical protein
MGNDMGGLILIGLDGSRETLAREDIIASILRRWRRNGFKCPDARRCLDGMGTTGLTRMLLGAVLGDMPACPKARLKVAVRELEDNIQN